MTQGWWSGFASREIALGGGQYPGYCGVVTESNSDALLGTDAHASIWP